MDFWMIVLLIVVVVFVACTRMTSIEAKKVLKLQEMKAVQSRIETMNDSTVNLELINELKQDMNEIKKSLASIEQMMKEID